MGSLDNWSGECMYIEGLCCPHQMAMYTSGWRCFEDCEKLRPLVTRTKNGVDISWGKVVITRR